MQLERDRRRLAGIATALLLFLASAVPPFHYGPLTAGRDLGYSLIFVPPLHGSIDPLRLAVEYVAIFAAGTLLWLTSASDLSVSAISRFQLPQGLKRALSLLGKALLLFLVLASYAVAKTIGIIVLAIYIPAVALYFLGKVSISNGKTPLLLVMSIMGAQAFWTIIAAIFALIQDGHDGIYMANQQMNHVVGSLVLALVYFAAIAWFLRSTSARSAISLLFYVAMLDYLWSSAMNFGDAPGIIAKSATLQVVTYSVVLILIPISYLEYAKSAHSHHDPSAEEIPTSV